MIISFTDYNIDAVDWIGWAYVGITGLLIAYTIISVVVMAINLLWQKIKEKCEKKAIKEEIAPQKKVSQNESTFMKDDSFSEIENIINEI